MPENAPFVRPPSNTLAFSTTITGPARIGFLKWNESWMQIPKSPLSAHVAKPFAKFHHQHGLPHIKGVTPPPSNGLKPATLPTAAASSGALASPFEKPPGNTSLPRV